MSKLIGFDIEDRTVEFEDKWKKVYEKDKCIGEVCSGTVYRLSKKEVDKISEFILSLKEK